MNGELFSLAIEGLFRKKRSSLLLFAVLLLSFAFAVLSLTVTGSIRKTNEEYRLDSYGAWYGAIPNGWETDEAFLREQPWLDELGITQSYGSIQAPASGSTSIGVMNEEFLRVGRISLQDGRFPQDAGEIAMEADLLSALGYDYTLGQEITMTVAVPATAHIRDDDSETPKARSASVPVERTYILCGVVREYADLWVRTIKFLGMPPLNSAMITVEAAEALRQAAQTSTQAVQDAINRALDGEGEVLKVALNPVMPQYYFSATPGCENAMQEQGDAYLRSTRGMGDGDRSLTINTAAFTNESEDSIEGFYAGLILAVTLLAVVCIYAIQLQDEARQLAIFRSIGITKRQLCAMLLYETLCLGVPAMVLGAVCGALGTWLLLQLTVYAGSVSVQVAVPPALLLAAVVLWLAGVLAARLGVFLIALRAPLTGRFYIARQKAQRYRHWQQALTAGLFALLCAAVFFTVMESQIPLHLIKVWTNYVDYIITLKGYRGSTVLLDETSSYTGEEWYRDLDLTIPTDKAPLIERVPGMTRAWGFGTEEVRLDFDGMQDVPLVNAYRNYWEKVSEMIGHKPEQAYGTGPYDRNAMTVNLVVVDADNWQNVVDFDIDRERFLSGDAVLMAFRVDAKGMFLNVQASSGGYPDTGLSVGDSIRITIGTPDHYTTTETIVGGFSRSTPDMDNLGLSGLNYPYTIICSPAFLEKLLDSLGPGKAWNEYRQGTPYGYEMIYGYADLNAGYLSTDTVLAQVCSQEGLQMDSRREQNQTYAQEYLQTLILLFAAGGGVVLVLLLILGNTLSMEAEREKRKYGILQALGMSRRQMKLWKLGASLLRGALAALFGWLIYGVYFVGYALYARASSPAETEEVRGIWEILTDVISRRVQYYNDQSFLFLLTGLCIGLILAVSWLAKQRLFRDDLMAKLRDEH